MSSKFLKSSEYFVCFGKLFGVSLFSLSNPGPDYFDFLYAIPFLTVYCYIVYRGFAVLGAYEEIEGNADISITTLKIILTQHLCSYIAKLVYYYALRRKFKAVFFKIQKLNDFLKLPEMDHTVETVKVTTHFCIAVCLNAYTEIYNPISRWVILVHELFYFVGYVEISLMYKLLNQLSRQCRCINEHLQKRISFLALDKIHSKANIWNELLDVKKLRQSEKDSFFDNAYEMAKTHLTIGQIAKDINVVFGVSILLGVMGDFVMLTSTTVNFCQDIRQLLGIGLVQFSIMLKASNNAIHDMLILIKECYTIYYWTKLKKTLKETVTCLHKMWNTLAKHNEVEEKSNYLQLLIVQLFNGMPNFSSFEILDINWPLIIYVISTAATYVVIIMQFQLATKPQSTYPLVNSSLTN